MSATDVTCLNAGDGSGVLPIVELTVTTFVRLNRLKPSSITSTRCACGSEKARDTRTSKVAVPHARVRSPKHGSRPELRPTPSGRSLTVVSLLLSAPVTMLNGAADAYA